MYLIKGWPWGGSGGETGEHYSLEQVHWQGEGGAGLVWRKSWTSFKRYKGNSRLGILLASGQCFFDYDLPPGDWVLGHLGSDINFHFYYAPCHSLLPQ